MYNQERKEEFIKNYISGEKTAYYVRVIFKEYDSERVGEEVSFEEYVEGLLESKNYEYNRNTTRNKIKNDKIRGLVTDYDKRKCAFAA